MAITRTEIAKQLLANGGRIGFKGGADMGTVDAKDKKGNVTRAATNKASNLNVGAGGASFEDLDSNLTGNDFRRAKEEFERGVGESQLDNLKIKDRNLPGLLNMGLNLLNKPRQFMLDKNVDYFKSLSGIENKGYPKTAEGYRQYMADRQAGKIDAAGNLIMGGDDDNNDFIPVDTTFDMASNDMNQEEDEYLNRRYAAEGGIMDLETGRQMYGLGKLVKKVTRGIKKIAKSPIGKAALIGGGLGLAGIGPFQGLRQTAFGKGLAGFFGEGSFNPFKTAITGVGKVSSPFGALASKAGITDLVTGDLTGVGKAVLGLGVPMIAAVLTPEQEDEAQKISDETGIDIQEIRNNPDKYLGRAFKAGGGLMRLGYQEGSKEPVAKKTMPLLDMGGKEMDLREDGGFVPIGRMEKADDVPARLSKNEFVFTAEAVRNAGDGDIDKGSEVMYNMMKNLESGGDVSEESQGLEGARKMFQTSQRLEEVL